MLKNRLALKATPMKGPTPVNNRWIRSSCNFATGIERLRMKHGGRLPAIITLDVDPTDDPTHGNQQLTFLHGFYEQFQHLPLIISEPTTKHVFVAWLRPGTVHAADDDLMRVVNALRAERPDIIIHVRGDAGFGAPWMYEVCEANGLFYTFGFSSNPRLQRLTADLLKQAEKQFEETKQKARLFDCFQYQCNGWPFTRSVVANVECHAGGTNRRFVVTNLPSECPLPPLPETAAQAEATPMESAPSKLPGITTAAQGEIVYDDYIQRGESEQRMDELKNGLHTDRLSFHCFMANFFRLDLDALMDEMREKLDLTAEAGQLQSEMFGFALRAFLGGNSPGELRLTLRAQTKKGPHRFRCGPFSIFSRESFIRGGADNSQSLTGKRGF